MHQNKRFGKLVFYLEACESDINVYAITSSTPTKMSGKMYPDKYYHTTIGSFFAHYWLLNDEQVDLNKETLQQQFDYIYKWTNTPGQEREKVIIYRRIKKQYVDKHMTEYVNSIQHLLTVDSNAILNTKQELNNRECYRKLVDNSHDNCFNMNQNPYVLGKLYIFVNICEEMRESSDADINAVNQLLIQY
ncbi:unnamed protein product, partial [Medioppia subpectinata]